MFPVPLRVVRVLRYDVKESDHSQAESDHHLHIRAAGGRGSEIAEGLWRVSLHAVDTWTLRTSPDDVADNPGPFERLLGHA